MDKGQIMSGDFIISIAVFSIILVFILPSFLHLSGQIGESERHNEVGKILIFTSDSLLRSSGFPNDWNTTSVQSIGLANADGTLNLTKIRNFAKIDYGTARRMLGFGAYNFNLSFYDLNNYPFVSGAAQSPAAYFYSQSSDAFSLINGSGLVWDLYYAGPGDFDAGDSRNAYNGSGQEMFDTLMSRQREYRTVIMENPQLLQSDVNVSRLIDFVSSGGLLLFVGNASLIQTGFSMHLYSGSGSNGIVFDPHDLMDAFSGDSVAFTGPTWYAINQSGDSTPVKIVYDTSQPERMQAAAWSHGMGMVYYLTGLSGTASGKALKPLIYIAGSRVDKSVPHYGDISSIVRISMISGRNQPVRVILSVFR